MDSRYVIQQLNTIIICREMLFAFTPHNLIVLRVLGLDFVCLWLSLSHAQPCYWKTGIYTLIDQYNHSGKQRALLY